MQVKTIEQLKRLKPQDGQFVAVEDEGAEYIFRENRPDLTPDDNAIHASVVHGREDDRWEKEKAQETSGGGSGSAYPQSVITTTENRVLTSADQGIIIALAPGLTIKLPATAENGETYIIVSPAGVTVDPNGNDVLGGFNTDAPFEPGVVTLRLMAIDLGAGLSWVADEQTEILNYSATKTYRRGDMVLDDDRVFLSINNGNTGNPVTNPSYWTKISSHQSAYQEMEFGVARELGVGYTNSTARPLVVFVSLSLGIAPDVGSGGRFGRAQVYVGGVMIADIRPTNFDSTTGIYAGRIPFTIIVPPGATYQINDAGDPGLTGVGSWFESWL
jgi:hypothetical protein